MKKSILDLGKILNKTEQKTINGGRRGGSECGLVSIAPVSVKKCPPGAICVGGKCIHAEL